MTHERDMNRRLLLTAIDRRLYAIGVHEILNHIVLDGVVVVFDIRLESVLAPAFANCINRISIRVEMMLTPANAMNDEVLDRNVWTTTQWM